MFGRNPRGKEWLCKNYRITRKNVSHVDHFQEELKLETWTIITPGEEDSERKETRKCFFMFITTFTFCSTNYIPKEKPTQRAA